MSTFSDIITFTRSTTGTYRSQSGLVETGAVNAPRFEYDGSGNPLGLLVEEARTNIALQSEDMTAASKTGVTVTSNARFAPDRLGFADLLKLSTTAEAHHVSRGGNATASTKYGMSCFVRKAQGTTYLAFGGLGIGSNPPVFNIVTGAITSTGSSAWTKVEVESYNDEFYRCSAIGAATATTPAQFILANDPSTLTTAGNGTDGAYLWGLQIEAAANFVTSYIPTVASTITRAADVTTVAIEDFYYRQAQGTLVVTFKPKYDETSSSFLRVAELGESATDQGRMPFLVETANTRLRFQAYESSSLLWNVILTASLPNDGAFVTGAVAYIPSSGRAAYEGSLAGSEDTTIPLTTTRNTIGIMQKANAGNTLTGHIKRFRYFPNRVSDSTLAALT